MKVGLYFGSFNPIHNGHLIVANTALQDTDLDMVWFVVAAQSPFKHMDELLDAQSRAQIVDMAIESNANFKVETVELRLPKPSYSINTIKALRKNHPECEFSIIMGADNLERLHEWKDSDEVVEEHDIFIYPRAGYEKTLKFADLAYHENVQILNVPIIEISSTYIRELIRKGKSPRYLMPDEALDYINYNQLYQDYGV